MSVLAVAVGSTLAATASAADVYRVPLVPFVLDGVALVTKMNGLDGIHPNADGAKRIADTVWRHLESALREQQATAATPSG
jgi:acyl-CoA thioesterase I